MNKKEILDLGFSEAFWNYYSIFYMPEKWNNSIENWLFTICNTEDDEDIDDFGRNYLELLQDMENNVILSHQEKKLLNDAFVKALFRKSREKS